MKGFTLIELLVVVIIIGILAGIAIPQYELVVEKSRASEALINAKAIRDAVDRHQQEYPEEGVRNFDQIADVEIKGVISTEGNTKKTTKYFIYEFYEGCGAATYTCFGVTRRDDEYTVSYEKDGPRSPWYIDEITMASNDYQQVTDLFRENI